MFEIRIKVCDSEVRAGSVSEGEWDSLLSSGRKKKKKERWKGREKGKEKERQEATGKKTEREKMQVITVRIMTVESKLCSGRSRKEDVYFCNLSSVAEMAMKSNK